MNTARTPAGERAVPYLCPFCGDEDLRPVTAGWHCHSCLRVFAVTFHGLHGLHGLHGPSTGVTDGPLAPPHNATTPAPGE